MRRAVAAGSDPLPGSDPKIMLHYDKIAPARGQSNSSLASRLPLSLDMARRPRCVLPGFVYHVVNRGSRKGSLFSTYEQYESFERLLIRALRKYPVAVFAYCMMPNHWHFLLYPHSDDALPGFMQWLTARHATSWHKARNSRGCGAVYQARFRAHPVLDGAHLMNAWRYVETNAVRAGLCMRVEKWRWGSAWQASTRRPSVSLARPPIDRPENWLELWNQPFEPDVLDALRAEVYATRGRNTGHPTRSPSKSNRQ